MLVVSDLVSQINTFFRSHHQRKCITACDKKRRRRSLSAPAILRTPEKKKRKKWTHEQMTAAIEAVEYGNSSINRAAMTHGVPKTTLKDRLSGRVEHGSKPGPDPYLNDEEEAELSTFLQRCSSMGYGKTRRDVINKAQAYAAELGKLQKDHS